MADDNPFAQYAEASPGGAGDNPFAKFKTPDAAPSSAPFLKGTTASGVAAAASRGLAPYAAGAALGAAAGAPFAGVGAVPGAIAGMGAVGLEELVSAVSKLGNKTLGTPAVGSVSDITDKALDAIGTKRPSTGAEQAVETGAGMVGGLPAAGPAAVAGKVAATKGGGAVADVIGGLGTHTGGESIRQALKAGAEGGQRAKDFLDAMRGNAPMEQVVQMARQALSSMRQARNTSYRSGLVDMKNDASILKFDDIDKAVTDASKIGNFHGQTVNPQATKALDDVADKIRVWKAQPPDQFHTVEGLDALKQAIGGIRESLPFEAKQARLAVDGIYNAIKGTIEQQAPGYAKVMKDYSQASEQLAELEKAFSLGGKGKPAVDTALRKLQSIMRNNVNANYGNRLAMAKMMEEKSGKTLLPQLAGHSLSSSIPRGLGGPMMGLNLGAATYLHSPYLAAALPFQSPRLMGEAAYALGAAGRHIGNWWDSLVSAGGSRPQPFIPEVTSRSAAGRPLMRAPIKEGSSDRILAALQKPFDPKNYTPAEWSVERGKRIFKAEENQAQARTSIENEPEIKAEVERIKKVNKAYSHSNDASLYDMAKRNVGWTKAKNSRIEDVAKAPVHDQWAKGWQEKVKHLAEIDGNYESEARRATLEAIVRNAKKKGWKIGYTSKSGDRASSRYLEIPGTGRVRISDHELPMTDQRAFNHSQGRTGNWNDELIVDDWRERSLDDYMHRLEHGSFPGDD